MTTAVPAVRNAVRTWLENFEAGDTILVAVSGGADSLALAHALSIESKEFVISVIDTLDNPGTAAEMVEIDKFNDSLRANGQWIFAWGLQPPETATVIDNRNDANLNTGKPLFDAKENFSGLWLIEAESAEVAERLAYLASKACNRKVELRPMHLAWIHNALKD